MWLNDELALKALTPMLMPVTVMHDPRTAVGTIADCKLISETASARIDTILAIWRHRFPNVWEEAAQNIEIGQMMQSMECFTPWYLCSECGQQYIKLPNGAEQASWCGHLRGDGSSPKGRRILGDVCFTGTGLIFGSRGGVGAYTEAYLDHFQDEIAEYHAKAHVDSSYRPTQRSTSHMGLIQIEESELATLRQERNDARSELDRLKTENRDLTTKVETAESETTKLKDEKAAVEKERDDLKTEKQGTELASTRLKALGQGFLAKLGEFTRERLQEQASKLSDEEWDAALREREELAGVKRDAEGDKTAPAGGGGNTPPSSEANGFKDEEVASFLRQNRDAAPAGDAAPAQDAGTSVRQLARAFGK